MSANVATIFGFIGAMLMVTSYLMKSMLPLRIVALVACGFLAVYGFLSSAMPTLVLYVALLLINIRKTLQIKRLVRAISLASADTPVSQWLLPNMTRRTVTSGTTLWRKGDEAGEMLYLESGHLCLVEYNEMVLPGSLVGEIGLFAPDHRRTLTLKTKSDCVVFCLSAETMALLYYQNPKLGYHVIRLIVARLMRDADLAREAAKKANPQHPDPRIG